MHHFDANDPLYGSIPPYLKSRIESLESRAQFIIGNETITRSESISKKRMCVFVHKCLHSKEFEDHFGDYFKSAFLIRVGILLLPTQMPTQIGKLTIHVGKKNAEANFFDYMSFLIF